MFAEVERLAGRARTRVSGLVLHGFANSTRLSILLLLVHQELRGEDLERVAETVAEWGIA